MSVKKKELRTVKQSVKVGSEREWKRRHIYLFISSYPQLPKPLMLIYSLSLFALHQQIPIAGELQKQASAVAGAQTFAPLFKYSIYQAQGLIIPCFCFILFCLGMDGSSLIASISTVQIRFFLLFFFFDNKKFYYDKKV